MVEQDGRAEWPPISCASLRLSPGEVCDAGVASLMSVFTEKACIRKDPLGLVVGCDRYRVNNIFDGKMAVRPTQEILKEAESRVGEEVDYSVHSANCEHFVTDLRYGVARSGQVDDVMVAAKAAVGAIALGAIAGLCYQLVKRRDRQKE
ncbi:phospholipase A and acyltransferase 3-like [Chiloscyllium plagiosum]|uniref:phospholipase A and acyltransferase 3-like n=1 Tax=Chiloscyllium plagiosum TaxID=36176 RepID=UPI001CB83E5E|nr:phospholipase A and acyltransferase 3-like [Chiloscyllium plagiosum]